MTGREQRDPASPAQIPCILHQIFPAGEIESVKQAVDREQNGQHRKSCLDAHHAWEHRLWDRADAQAACGAPTPVVLGYLRKLHTGKLLKGEAAIVQLQASAKWAARRHSARLQDRVVLGTGSCFGAQAGLCRITIHMLGTGAAKQRTAIHTDARLWGLVLGAWG